MSFLLAYLDWRPISCACVIAVHHSTFNSLPLAGMNVYCFTELAWSIVLLNAAYAVVQVTLLISISMHMNADAQSGLNSSSLARAFAVYGEI
ncbi:MULTISPECIES: hypothetical protein [unclassified Paraburkholderia]|uniref:hypothetical protein n=1 Tax=unclassified Paraburkholderia TaxID=2615204 RepID=UPI00161C423A|nr:MULTISPECIES: hypothetical protein [unclassified Paraburkholderia]MBB5445334.1 heme/copper-type cytochrome/quinol oxidase subunit 4 [Paraburkholderia sp. WSM4177]MBB5485882.1 heme/copper-type cytochrome/quinol oxidase subunit 4 [Paraburkholderia sp. WSM4180]